MGNLIISLGDNSWAWGTLVVATFFVFLDIFGADLLFIHLFFAMIRYGLVNQLNTDKNLNLTRFGSIMDIRANTPLLRCGVFIILPCMASCPLTFSLFMVDSM
jgi:hypothetical protein